MLPKSAPDLENHQHDLPESHQEDHQKNHQDISEMIAQLDWNHITEQMHDKGFYMVKNILNEAQCQQLKADYDNPALYRKTVNMARHRFGLGEYKYFRYPLPSLLQQIRHSIYPHLVPIANAWSQVLNLDVRYPATLAELHQQCHDHQQQLATVLILKYGQDGFNTLHQDIYGEVYFPMQLVFVLSEPERDFTGGEFVLQQQIPRAQSKAMVLQPKQGDMLIFTTQFKPERGARGYYRSVMKHGVSPLHSGERYSLGVIFHDAVS